MSTDLSWQTLRATLAEDCRPVAPLRPVRIIVPWALFLLSALFLVLLGVFGLRTDAQDLGPMWLWLPSLIEILMAVALLAAGLDEATPSRGQSPGMVALGVGAGALTHCIVATLTVRQSPVLTSDGPSASAAFLCMRMEFLLALPLLLVALVILRRGLVARPARSGLCLGIGAGIGADALWRLVCPFADLRHVLSAHLSGIACVLLAGTLLGIGSNYWHLRRWHRGRPPASFSSPSL
jgi:hypothetical protein